MKKSYRAGVIGLGNIGMLYELDTQTLRRYPSPSHTSCYAANPSTELVAGCDLAPERRERFEGRYPSARVYQDVEKMLAEAGSLDLVSVCVPPAAQPDVVGWLVNAGVSMILCEKPLGTSAERARALAEQCQRGNVGLAVNYWRRFDESHQQIASLITQGRLGILQHLHGYYGNGLLRNASHVINLWLWYAGPIDWVSASPGGTEPSDEQNANVLCGFASGARGSLTSVSYEAYRLLEVDLIGTEGRITLKNEGLDLMRYEVHPNEDVSGARQLVSEGQPIPSTVGRALSRAVETLVGWLNQGERPIDEQEAIDTLAVLEAIEQSAAEGGRRVSVVYRKPAAQEISR